jgi:methylamine dehydrogenase heavy chain
LINSHAARAEIYNADTGQFLGQIALGIGANSVEIDKRNKLFHVAETYMSRHTRGERTDVVTSYDFRTLSAKGEVSIPNKHSSGQPIRSYTGLTDDARFMMVNNISPAQSISVVDLRESEFVGEIATPGCGLVYPTGKRAFLQLCGDGMMQLISLDNDGAEKSRARSERFFSVNDDPVTEKAVRTDLGWVFSTFKGNLYRVSVADETVTVKSLFNLDKGGEGWRLGGIQPVAYHAASDLLLALMHQGGEDTHKDPGTEVWMFNLASQRLIHRMKLDNMATAIAVSQDDKPRIYSTFVGGAGLDVYDLLKGGKVHSIQDLIQTPTIIQNLQL